jgi:hypothetical protein
LYKRKVKKPYVKGEFPGEKKAFGKKFVFKKF